MLMESVSDPRRANWLTITSMSEDLCWPDEPELNNARPSWELEAEILRLTTRLMMRERELRQVKSQLKAQASKTQQQATSWRRRMEEKEEQVKELFLQKDAEMQNIVSQLLLFEAELRREQSRIEDLLAEKDMQIQSQKKEIDRLTRSLSAEDYSAGVNSCSESKSSAQRTSSLDENNSIYRTFSLQERNAILKTSSLEDKDSVFKTSGIEDKDSAFKIISHENRNSYRTSNSEDSGIVISSSDSCPSPLEDISDVKEEDIKCDFPSDIPEDSRNDRAKKNGEKELRKQRHFSSAIFEDDRFDYSKKLRDLSCSKEMPKQRHSYSAVFEDPYDSQFAVQKLRDGLVKIRAIQDVTNVKTIDLSYDSLPEKKRTPYKAPQKMKDLKAKRTINPHKFHRNTVGEINSQVIL